MQANRDDQPDVADTPSPRAPRGLARLRQWHRSRSEPVRIAIWTLVATAFINIGTLVSGVADVVAVIRGNEIVVTVQPAPLPSATSGALAGRSCQQLSPLGSGSGGPEAGVYVRAPGGCWSQLLGYVPSGSELEYLVTYKNGSSEPHDSVTFSVDLHDGMRLVAGSTRWMNASHPEGVAARSDDIQNAGINVGSYAPGANAWVTFRVTIPGESEVPCGVSEYRLVGFAGPWGSQTHANSSVLSAYRAC